MLRKSLWFVVASFAALLSIASTASAKDGKPASREDAIEGRDKKSEGVSIGVLGGIGFPRPFAIESVVDLDRRFMLGAEYGFLPQARIAGIHTSLWAASGDVRWFPFRKGLFLGLRGGFQHVAASATVDAGSAGIFREGVAIDTWFLNPRIGVLWIWKPLVLGVELGAQFPLGVSTSSQSNIPSSTGITTQVASAAERVGRTVLPTVDLLRVGLLF